MRLTSAALLLLLAPGVAAQGPTMPAGSQVAAAASPVPGLERPSDVVARLAREALASPGDSTAWRALAGALPDMALSGDADLEGTFEAARLADSLSAATGVAVTSDVDPGGAPLVEQASPPAVTDPGAPASWWPPALSAQVMIGTLFGALALVGLRMTRTRRRVRMAPPSPAHRAEQGRLWTARTLATGGVDVPEIAKRTGMAQEAGNLALSLAGHAPVTDRDGNRRPMGAPAGRGPSTPATPRATGPRPAEDRIRREVTAGVGRLRDRCLTYGGGAAT